MPSLPDLEAFEAAARHGSFVAAAAELHLTPSAVSHRVKGLERQLGVPLFVRLARRIELTDHGRAYMPHVRRAFDELAVATSGMFGWSQPERRLTVRMPISYAVNCVAPTVKEFKERHPDIELRIVSAIWADTVASSDVDLDIRYGFGNWAGHRAELLHRETVTAIWSPEFEARFGRVTDPSQLGELPRVHILGQEHPWSDRAGSGPVVSVDTSLAAKEMVASGAFSTVLLTRFATADIAAGRFLTIPSATAPIDEAHYVVADGDDAPFSTDALLFIDWLRQNAAAAAAPVGATAAVRRTG